MTLLPPPDRIYLMRHAKSGWAAPGQRDFDRTLDDEGYDEAEIICDLAADRSYRPDIVVSSTAVRCRQTADAVRRAFPGDLEFRFIDALYNAPLDSYLEILASLHSFSSVMVIGHNPAMEEILGKLIGIDALNETIPDGYPTAGLAVLDPVAAAESGKATSWTLTDFLSR